MATGGALVGALRVTLGIDASNFEAGTKRAKETASSAASSITKSFGGMQNAVTGLMAGISVGAIVAAASRALDYASSLQEVSQQLGIVSKDLQQYRYAATQVGISQEDMDKSLSKLTLTMGQARAGAEGPKAVFKELSDLLGKDILKSAATAGDAIPLISDALAKVPDPARRAALEVGAFGKTGQKLDTLLAGGSAAINEMREAAEKLGLVLSDEQIQHADDAADKLATLQQVLSIRIASTVADNAKAIDDFADSLIGLAGAASKAFEGMKNSRLLSLVGADRSTRAMWRADTPSLAMALAQGKTVKQASADAEAELLQSSAGRQGLLTKTANEYNGTRDPARRKELRAREARIRAAEANANKPSTPAPASAGAGAGKDKTPKTKKEPAGPKIDPAKQEDRYQSELARLEEEELRDRSALADTTADRLDLAKQRIDNDVRAFKTELDTQVLAKQITPERAAALLAAKKHNANLEKDIEDDRADDEITKAALSASDARLSLQSDLLKGDLGEAKTQAERRAIQLKLLDIEYDRQRNALQAAIDSHDTKPEDRQAAQDRLAKLGLMKSKDVTATKEGTAGPLEAFGLTLHRTAGQITEDFQQIEVDGIKSFNDGLVDAIVNSKSLGDVFSSVAKQIEGDLIHLALQAAESSLFGSKSTGGGLIGGLLSVIGIGGHTLGGSSISNSLFKGLSQGNGLPRFANGGAITVPNRSGIDTNLLSINGMPTARVNSGETIGITPANERQRAGPTIVNHNDFRGADAAAVPRIEAALKRLDGSIERRSITAVADARDRRVMR